MRIYYTINPKRQEHPEEAKELAIKMYCGGVSDRDVGKILGMNKSAEDYCTDEYSGYLDVVFPGKHIFNIHNKNDTFPVESVNADLRHYIPTPARRSRCFPRKLENLQAVLAVFVQAYNRFGLYKFRYRSIHPNRFAPFSVFDFL